MRSVPEEKMMFDLDYDFLSNFYPSTIVLEELTFPTVEHAFQAYKCKDPKDRVAFTKNISPAEAKRMGRKVSLRKDWEDIKDDIMFSCLLIKFKDERLKQMLLETGDTFLVEGTLWHDSYWGDCYCESCTNIKGQNKLGYMLMEIRDKLIKEIK